MWSLLLLGSVSVAWSWTCFEDAVPEDLRKLVAQGDEAHPIGVWVNGWDAGDVTAIMVAILIEEKMGYKVEMMGPGPSTPDAFFALAGCLTPTNISDRKCGGSKTYVHISVEGWTRGYKEMWDDVQLRYPAMAPRNLGNMGYQGYSSEFLRAELQEHAYNTAGISLDFYRDYNVSWDDPARFFSRVAELNTSRLRPCSETNLMLSSEMKLYQEVTGDTDGVIVEGDNVQGKCCAGYFWCAPSCRSDTSKCLPLITGGPGWNIGMVMQKATLLNMPLAITVASSWSDYASLPEQYGSIFFWWAPDPTFLRLNPTMIMYPPHDADAWDRGDRRSAPAGFSIDKYVSQDLSILAPDVEDFMKAYRVDIKDVNKVMLDKLQSQESYRNLTCKWFKDNEHKWASWLPDQSRCFAGYGMYKNEDEQFVQSRAEAAGISCKLCPPGYRSQQVRDDKGFTHACQPCDVGTHQPVAGAEVCNACPTGKFQNMVGSHECQRCPIGEYQDKEGQSTCTACPGGTSTVGFASASSSDCGCREGSIDIAPANASGINCIPCSEGLQCPFSSSVDTLVQGSAPLGPEYVPQVVRGFTSKPEDATSTFKCTSHCPGGKPGICSGGLEGPTCAACPEGLSWNGEECGVCHPVTLVLWLLGIVGVAAVLLCSYYFVNSALYARASPIEGCVMGMGVTAYALQTIALLGLTGMRWPSNITNTSTSLRIFLLDTDGLSVGCIAGSTDVARYVVSAMMFPASAAWLASRWALSVVLPKRWSWDGFKTANTAGVFLQVGSVPMMAVSMKAFMCYKHPNNLRSLVSYPNVFCGDGDQVIMMLVGLVLLGFQFTFLAQCVYGTWQIPKWTTSGRSARVKAFRFLTGKFCADSWWWGLIALTRSIAMNLAVAVAVDAAHVQRAVLSFVFLVYLCFEVRTWPWKVPLVNMADAAVHGGLLLLLGLAQDGGGGPDKVNVLATLVLFCMFSMLVLIAILSALALLSRVCGGTGDLFLNIGISSSKTREVAQALKECAEDLLKLELEVLEQQMANLNLYDLKTLMKAITIVSMDVTQAGRKSLTTRVESRYLSQDAPAMKPAVPVDSQLNLEANNRSESMDVYVEDNVPLESPRGRLVSEDFLE